MILFKKMKDGGPDSPVDGYFLIEIKGLFSIALLKFNKGRRETFHSHAFNAWTWLLKGQMREQTLGSSMSVNYTKSLIPKVTKRNKFHRVVALKDSWCITIRGPWRPTWREYDPKTREYSVLTHTRKVLRKYK